MNILQVFNGFADRWNANAYYALTISEGLSKKGHKVICICDEGSPFLDHAQKRGLQTVSLAVDTNNPFRYFPIRGKISRLIRSEEIDLINCHRGMVMAAYYHAARSSGRRVQVIRTHGEPRFPNTGFFARIESGRIDKYIVTTEKLRNYYIEHMGIPSEKVRTIYGGVSYAVLDEKEKTEGAVFDGFSKSTSVKLGILGRMSINKGHESAVRALKTVLEHEDAELHIAGSGPESRHKELVGLALGLGIPEEKLHIHGFIKHPTEFINGIDVCLVPSLCSEMISRVLMEFSLFGKPAVGAEVNSLGEIIRSFGMGLTYPAGDSEKMAEQILKVIRSGPSDGEYALNSRKAYNETFNPDLFTQQTLDFYLG